MEGIFNIQTDELKNASSFEIAKATVKVLDAKKVITSSF